jgi:hypothetical protein
MRYHKFVTPAAERYSGSISHRQAVLVEPLVHAAHHYLIHFLFVPHDLNNLFIEGIQWDRIRVRTQIPRAIEAPNPIEPGIQPQAVMDNNDVAQSGRAKAARSPNAANVNTARCIQ